MTSSLVISQLTPGQKPDALFALRFILNARKQTDSLFHFFALTCGLETWREQYNMPHVDGQFLIAMLEKEDYLRIAQIKWLEDFSERWDAEAVSGDDAALGMLQQEYNGFLQREGFEARDASELMNALLNYLI